MHSACQRVACISIIAKGGLESLTGLLLCNCLIGHKLARLEDQTQTQTQTRKHAQRHNCTHCTGNATSLSSGTEKTALYDDATTADDRILSLGYVQCSAV